MKDFRGHGGIIQRILRPLLWTGLFISLGWAALSGYLAYQQQLQQALPGGAIDQGAIWRAAAYTLLTTGGTLLPLVVIAWLRAYRLLCRPLHEIRDYLQQLDAATSSESVAKLVSEMKNTPQEIVTLLRAVEDMRGRFVHTVDELHKSEQLFESAYEDVRMNEERFEMAVRATNEGIYDWNIDNNQVYFSERWKEMLGDGRSLIHV